MFHHYRYIVQMKRFNIALMNCILNVMMEYLLTEKVEPVPRDPCHPSPCGANAVCSGDGHCTCIAQYHGDPYSGCRPECTMNTDCSPNRACTNLRCVDPCPGTCGQGASCNVINHIPTCSCPDGMSGDPFVVCRPVQIIGKTHHKINIIC